jgi:uncharacterized SAM-dependent methyltransferase
MKKKLFTNYNLELDKNERKLLSSFCKQALKQLEGNKEFFGETRAFNSILGKLNSEDEIIKLTKDEKTRLTHQLKENMNHLQKEMTSSWFIKKWMVKSLYNQYNNLYENHLKG